MENKNDSILLEARNLFVEYTSAEEVVHAVNGVSFSLKKGETLGFVGETGAGKTSIAKAILRILPDPPAKVPGGEILFEGTDMLTLSDSDMRKIRGGKISMIFQDPMTALNPVLTVGRQIAEVLALHEGLNKNEAIERSKNLLEMVGIPGERYGEYPHQFSGGMKQRVVIAIALACSPELLIADEPTTALDVTIQAQVLELIRQLQRKTRMAMIMITHDFGIVAETCNNVAVVYGGQIIESGTTRQILQHATHPYTTGLLSAIPQMDVDVERLNNIGGMPPDPTDLPEGCYFSPRCKYASEQCKKPGEIPQIELGGGHVCRCIKAKELYKA